jgi:hypothetical protein
VATRLVQHAVNAIAHAHVVFEGLDMDVRGSPFEGRLDDLVHEPDDRRIGVIADRSRRRGRLFFARGHGRSAIGGAKCRLERAGRGERGLELAAGHEGEVVEHEDPVGVVDRDVEDVALLHDRQRAVLERELRGDAFGQARGDLASAGIDEAHAVRFGDRLVELGLREQSELEHRLGDVATSRAGELQDLLQSVRVEETRRNEMLLQCCVVQGKGPRSGSGEGKKADRALRPREEALQSEWSKSSA